MTVNLYMPRVSIDRMGITAWDSMERLITVSKWVEQQFGRADYHTNYTMNFADHTDDWAVFQFYDSTQAFWTQARWADWMLTQEQWDDMTMPNWGG
jgi:hypothetical protein